MTDAGVVVVGAGTAGAVIAARLSEDPRRRVTVLEAGPSGWAKHLDGPSFFDALDTPGRTWPDLTASRAVAGAPRRYLRGRGVGGSSSVNAMVAMMPTAGDLRRWQDLGGWGPELADVAVELAMTAPADDELGPFSRSVLSADPDARRTVLTRTVDGRRCGSYAAYLAPAMSRPNLVVRGDALVDRVLLRGSRCCGVRLAGGEEIRADRVVVCAGAIHSPAILLRSELSTAGIGAGLQDHPSFPIPLAVRRAPGARTVPVTTVVQFTEQGGDLQLLPVDGPQPHAASLIAAVMTVRSRGTVRLASADPLVDPLVEFDMLAHPHDRQLMDAAIDRAETVLSHPEVADVARPLEYDRSTAGIRAALGDYVHAAGSCAMGTVVDRHAAVIGYQSLYVCDTSVMPCIPTVNTYLAAVLIAERFASLARSAW